MKTIWKATVCIVAVLLSFSIYSCGDDDDDAVGSRDLLLGTWNGVYYLSQEWEDGEKVSDSKEDFVNGTNRYSIEFKEDGTYVEKDVYIGKNLYVFVQSSSFSLSLRMNNSCTFILYSPFPKFFPLFF